MLFAAFVEDIRWPPRRPDLTEAGITDYKRPRVIADEMMVRIDEQKRLCC